MVNKKPVTDNNQESPGSLTRRRLMALAGASGVGLGLGGLETTVVHPAAAATGGTVIDDFEDDTLAEYHADPDNSNIDMSGVNITGDQVHDGTQSLEIDAVEAEITSQSGLNAYPAAGDTFSVWVRTTGGS